MKINVVVTMWCRRLQNRSTEIFHSKYMFIKKSDDDADADDDDADIGRDGDNEL